MVKILAFFTAGAVLHYSHREYVHQLEGLGKRMPVTFVCYTVAACALTGVPPFNGFVSKWYIALAAVDTYQPLPIIGFGVLLVSALLTAIYMFQIAVRAWFPRHSAPAIPEGSVHEAGWQMLVPMVVLAAACLLTEDTEMAVTSTEGRVVVFHTAALTPKTTRSTQGVNVMTLKPKYKVADARPLADTTIVNAARYRARSLPIAGMLLRPEDRAEEQMTLLE